MRVFIHSTAPRHNYGRPNPTFAFCTDSIICSGCSPKTEIRNSQENVEFILIQNVEGTASLWI